MTTDIIDLGRLFRNRFERFMDHFDMSGAGVMDGSRLTLRDICNILKGDTQPFPLRYDPDKKKLCGNEFQTWLREEGSYGDIVHLVARCSRVVDGRMPLVRGRWVHAVLDMTGES